MRRMFVRVAIVLVAVCAVLIDARAQEVRVIDGKGTVQLVTVNRVSSSAVAPVGPVEGDVWFDTSTNRSKLFDGASWLEIDPDRVTVANTPPTLPINGDIWFDTSLGNDSLSKVYDGTSWIDFSSDNQKIDTLALQGDTLLQISLEGDGEAAKTLDLSSLSTKEPWFGTDDDAVATENNENIYHLGKIALGTDSATERLDVNGKLRLRNRLDKTDADTTVRILVADSNGVIDEMERYWITEARRTPSTSNIFSSSMTATQSSTYQSSTANRAIDGNTASNDRALTNFQVYPWWKIDMGTDTTINRLRFFQYHSSQFRLSNFYIVFSTSDISLPATPTASDLTSLLCNNDHIHYSGQIPYQSSDVTFPDKTFRYMIVVRDISTSDYLQMSEVQAFNDDVFLSEIGTMKKKVGIGTVSPVATLHVAGDARITSMPAGGSSDDVVVVNGDGDLKKVSQSSLGSDNQNLSITTDSLKIEDGTGVALSAVRIDTMSLSNRIDNVVANDNDHDSTNELQRIDTLALQGDTLLQISLEGDGQEAQSVDLRGLVNEPWFGTDNNAGATDNTEDIYLMGNMAVGQDSVSPGKVATFNGDVDIKGVLDPTKLIFSGDGTVGSFDPTTNNQYEIEFQEGRDLEIKSNTTDSIIHVQNDGRVGIGTASPSAMLTVATHKKVAAGKIGEIIPDFESFSSSYF